ncbi:hypothetical protein ACTXT7_001038, partial [Hymenolepis weldensis]
MCDKIIVGQERSTSVMSRRRSLGVMIDTCLGIYVQAHKHTAGPPMDTAVEILSPVFTDDIMFDETAAHILGGGIGGTVGAICTCPLELVKTRFQSSQGLTISGLSSSRPNSSATLKFTSSSVLIRSAQTVTIATHPSAKCNVAHIPPGLTHKGISCSPQFCRDYLLRSKIIKCMLDVCRTEGYLALFKGLVPTLLGVLPSRCIYFCAYHEGQKFFQQYFPEGHSAVFMLAAGCG